MRSHFVHLMELVRDRLLQNGNYFPFLIFVHVLALAGALSCAVGNALAGYFMKFMKLRTLGSSRIFLSGMVVLIIMLVTMANLGCDQPPIHGVSYQR